MPALLGGRADAVDGLGDDQRGRGDRLADGRLLGLDAAELEQVVDGAADPDRLVQHPLGQAAGDRGVVLAEQRLGQQAERPDRRLQLVADVGHEVAADRLEPAALGDVVDRRRARRCRRRSSSGVAAMTSVRRGGPNRSSGRAGGRRPASARRPAARRWPPRPGRRRGGLGEGLGRRVAEHDLAVGRRTISTPCGMASRAGGRAGPRSAVWSSPATALGPSRRVGGSRWLGELGAAGRPRLERGPRRASEPGAAVGAAAGPRARTTADGQRRRLSAARTGVTEPIRAPPAPAASASRRLARSAPSRCGAACSRAAPRVLGQPAGDHVPHPLADVHGVVADALVVPADQGELHRGLERRCSRPGATRRWPGCSRCGAGRGGRPCRRARRPGRRRRSA